MSFPLVDLAGSDVVADSQPPAERMVDRSAYDAANAAFQRELPALLKLRSDKRRWVLFCRDQRIGLAGTKTELHRLARQLGLSKAEIVVRYITDVPFPTDIDELPDV